MSEDQSQVTASTVEVSKMAPSKRARPAFSPPRPGKSKSAISKSRGSTEKHKGLAPRKKSSLSKYAGRKGTRQALLDDEASEEDDEESEESDSPRSRKRNARSALALVDKDASDDSQHDTMTEDDEHGSPIPTNHDRSRNDSSPEPDMILAEITTHSTTTDTAIPPQLVHKLLHHHFERPEKTKISAGARDLVTEYLVTFLREAIVRSNEERKRREGVDGGGGSGFLEVEDLERSAVQLSLDF